MEESDGRGGAFSRKDLLWTAGVAAPVFALYLATLAPTVLYYSPETFDSAHLQVVANVLGIPSYTGYPTYAMLTPLFTYLPFGDAAYRVNLFSAIVGAVAVALIFLVGRRLGAGRLGAALGAAAFDVSGTPWSQAIIAEVYTLHALLTALFLLALLLWRDQREERFLLLAALLGGLAMTNHLTSVFLMPAALLYVFLADRRALARPGLWAKGMGLFLLGLLPYLYLPVRASMRPPLVDAGPAPDPSTPAGFLGLVSGGEHKARMLVFGPAELPERLADYGGRLLENLGPAAIALAALGVVVLLLRDRAGLALLGGAFVLNLAYALEYDVEDLEIYFVPTYLFLCLALSVGAGALLGASFGRSWTRPLFVALVALVAAATLWKIPGTYGEVDRSQDYRGREMLEAVARGTKPDATVLYHGRTLHYMQLVEGRRRDLALVDPFYTSDWVGDAERALRSGPVYILEPGKTNQRLYKEAGYRLVPIREGMLYEIVRQSA